MNFVKNDIFKIWIFGLIEYVYPVCIYHSVPVDGSESSSAHIIDLVIREVKSSHKPHASKTIGIQASNSIMVHMQHSQQAISSEISAWHLGDGVMGDIQPKQPSQIVEKSGLDLLESIVRQIQVFQLSLRFEGILKESQRENIFNLAFSQK